MGSIVVKAEDLHLYSSRVWHVVLFVKHPELIISLSLAHWTAEKNESWRNMFRDKEEKLFYF